MVQGPAHAREAERLLGLAWPFAYGDLSGSVDAHTCAIALTGMAQVHATLALTAATAQLPYPSPRNRDDWSQAFAPVPPPSPEDDEDEPPAKPEDPQENEDDPRYGGF